MQCCYYNIKCFITVYKQINNFQWYISQICVKPDMNICKKSHDQIEIVQNHTYLFFILDHNFCFKLFKIQKIIWLI